MTGTKIATCCYCGTRAALQLRGSVRHELACSSCGAPLHNLKMLPKRPEPAPGPAAVQAAYTGSSHQRAMSRVPSARQVKYRKSKGFARRALAEIWDVIEDIID